MLHAAPKQAVNHILMANDVDTGASLEYRQLIHKMKLHSHSGTKQQQTNLDAWPKALGGKLKDPTQFSLYHTKQYQKSKLSLMAALWWTSIPTNLKLTVSASLWVATSSNIQGSVHTLNIPRHL
jgi:hypothetical protein